MGKLTATCFITLDSVVEAPHLWSGDFQSEDTGALNDAVLQEADAMVLGRDTYEGFAAAWPQRSGDRFSDKFNAMPKYVVSTTLKTADWNNSTILDADPFTRVRELRAEQNLLVWGSPSLVRGLLDEGLVDELVLLYSPIVLGEGKKLFPDGFGRHDLKVVESTPLSRRDARAAAGPGRLARGEEPGEVVGDLAGGVLDEEVRRALDRAALDLRRVRAPQLERVLVEERQRARAAPQRPRAAGDRAACRGPRRRARGRSSRPRGSPRTSPRPWRGRRSARGRPRPRRRGSARRRA